MEESLEKALEKLWEYLSTAGLRILGAAVILVVGLKLTNLLCDKLKNSQKVTHLDDSLRTFLRSLLSIALRVLVFVTAAMTLGIPSSSFITVMASAGVAVGLALQGALSNLAGGIMILIFKPFRVGDFIETADGMGTVKSITVFYTMITTIDNRQITMPNGNLMGNTVTNCSTESTRRVTFTYSVAYDSDLDRVRAAIREAALSCPGVLPDPEPMIWMSKHGDSALEYTLRVTCLREDYFPVLMGMNEIVKRSFDRAGISIPFPQMDVHFDRER